MTARIAILLSGRGSNMMSLVDNADGYRVVLVASDKPEAPGLAWARAHGLPTFALSPKGIGKQAYEAALDDALRSARVEAVALAGYMRLLSPGFVARWRGRILNIHPSLLPAYKGLDTHARALAAGDAEAGCSVHLVTEELDAGTVLGQARVRIQPGDTPETLAGRVLAEEHRLYPRILTEFCRAMTDPIDRVRQVALQLPGAKERTAGEDVAFTVEDRVFAELNGPSLRLLGADGWEAVPLADVGDWALIEDRVARSWELVAPAGLLEAGGR